ncbi:hypothetical protein NQX30_05430 [Candidatus Persebacteraceae bacterium Df01]|jgi:predicted GH43/DUF377 family glycosyl hydrolase|uniref:Glycosyl hydrolase family 32 N-terminal domain-containing protein n=1 Tax=Candidatus Doriopsillibacter californiensis TaxID=2970740 RepID=A0ABT7QM65_9GAMM|nr:hypothetical protein [Candidatus Persebacteraceae bacterium Df01]
MEWIKKGQIWKPGKAWWAHLYGMLPTPLYMPENQCIRIYFGTTDDKLFGRTTFLDVKASNPSHIVYEHDSYVLDVGSDGTFDDCGVVPSCIIKSDNQYYLYTVGFQRCVKIPFMLFAGLALSLDGKTYKRFSQAPILPRTPDRPYGQGAPCILKEGNRWRMWHWFASGWDKLGDKQYYRYHIGCAESHDGRSWQMYKKPCLSPQKNECGLARPWVIKHDEKYHMFFSRRTIQAGRISYTGISHAISSDGENWERQSKDVIYPSQSTEWDSEMVCYSAVIRVKDKWLMFYNGNDNGKTGFGWAELQGDL